MKDNQPHTAHTCSKVPFIYADPRGPIGELKPDGALCDVAPTILKVMEIEAPSEMTGKPLII